MRNRGLRQNLEGWLRTKTASEPPVPKPTRPPQRPPPRRPAPPKATLMTAQELRQPVMDRLAFIAIMGGSIVVAPLVARQRGAESVKVYRVGVLSPRTDLWTH